MEQIDILENERCNDYTEQEVARHDFFEGLSMMNSQEEMAEALAESKFA